MSKILFISSRDPFSGRFSGDVIRSSRIIKLLEKHHKLDIVYLGKENKKINNKRSFKSSNFFLKILNCLKFSICLEPIQLGFFYSSNLKDYVHSISNNYDFIFCHHFRSAMYLPVNFKGKKILEMGDLYSDNYTQTYKNLSFWSPLFYIYFFESLLVKKFENSLFRKFSKIIFFSKKDIKKIPKLFKNKILHIPEVVNHIPKKENKINTKYKYSKKNYKIMFVGNLGYLPNKMACVDFVKNIFPIISRINKKIEFHIIGNVKRIDAYFFLKNSKIKLIGQKNNIEKYFKNTICGIANLNIATGVQAKIFTYMSYGLPTICSKKVASNFNHAVLTYKTKNHFAELINNLNKSKKLSTNYSKRSKEFVKKYFWMNIRKNYINLFD